MFDEFNRFYSDFAQASALAHGHPPDYDEARKLYGFSKLLELETGRRQEVFVHADCTGAPVILLRPLH